MAPDRAKLDRLLRLARNAFRYRFFLMRGNAADRLCRLAAAGAGGASFGERPSPRGFAGDIWPFTRRAADIAGGGVDLLLRRDVDAASSYRRLLRRPWLRR